MFNDPAKAMKLQPTELPADPGMSEVRISVSLPYTIYVCVPHYIMTFNRNSKCFCSGDYPESWYVNYFVYCLCNNTRPLVTILLLLVTTM